MPPVRKRVPRWTLIACALWGAAAIPVLAADPPPAAPPAKAENQPSVADLERRIRELEEIVHRLEAERRPAQPPPAPVPVTPQEPAPARQPASAEPAATAGGEAGPPSQLPRADAGGGMAEAGGSGDGAPRGVLAGWDNDRGFFLRSQNG